MIADLLRLSLDELTALLVELGEVGDVDDVLVADRVRRLRFDLEALDDHERSVVWQHDAAGSYADATRGGRDLPEDLQAGAEVGALEGGVGIGAQRRGGNGKAGRLGVARGQGAVDRGFQLFLAEGLGHHRARAMAQRHPRLAIAGGDAREHLRRRAELYVDLQADDCLVFHDSEGCLVHQSWACS